jgi:hypothetical protein
MLRLGKITPFVRSVRRRRRNRWFVGDLHPSRRPSPYFARLRAHTHAHFTTNNFIKRIFNLLNV